MSKMIKILAKKEPFIKKFFKLSKNTSLQRTAFTLFVTALVFIDVNTEVWEKPRMAEMAYAAEAREVIHYPSEKLSMIVLHEGEAPELENISVTKEDSIVTYYSDDEPVLITEVMGLSSSNVLSSEEFITDRVIENNLDTEELEVNSKHNQAVKEKLKDVSEDASRQVEQSVEDKQKAKENLAPVYVNNPDMVIQLTESELDLFYRIVQCEAGSEDMIGKILVANVIINRVNSPKFPNTVEGVILSPKQFSPVSSGLIYSTVPSEETKEAVQRALSGEDYSDDSLYFIARRYCSDSATTWFDTALTKTIEYGNHEFFK
ncbi:MAG: cell wall hydrolase [Lachnospiraceae bacterium]|nr:cell wall hydrolase [Lachnospiraceae bacterium]